MIREGREDSFFAGSLWPGAWLVALALLAYGNSYPGAWIFDDPYTIPANPSVGTLWPPSAAFSSPPGSPAAGRPLTALSFHLNAAWSGLNPAAFRFVNIVIHAVNALLLFSLLRLLLARMPAWRDRAPAYAWLIAALWVVHPLNTSAVTYISQRAESLMALFFLATMGCLARLGWRGSSRGWMWAAAACAWAATLSKDVGAMAGLLVVPFERAFFSATWREAWGKRQRLFWLMLVPSAMFLALAYLSDPRQGTVRWSYQGINPWTYLCTQAAAVVTYLRLVFWPDPLVLDYGWPVAGTWREWVLQAVALTLILGAGLCWLVRRPARGFPVVFFFLVLAPSSSVVPVITEIMAEHRMYLPTAAVLTVAVLAMAAGLARLTRDPARAFRCVVGLCVIAAIALFTRTLEQNALYRDPVEMWRHNTEVTPLNRRSFFNLAHEYRVRGRHDEAIAAYRRALELSPDYPDAHAGLSYSYYDQGRYDQALLFAQQAVLLEPNVAEHYFTFAMTQARLGAQEQALAAIRNGLAVDPDSDRLKKASVVIYFMFDRTKDALSQLAYWSGESRTSAVFIATAAELAETAGRPDVAAALRGSVGAANH